MSQAIKLCRVFGFLILGLYCCTTLNAQVSKIGTAGAQFLEIGVDPRGVAMGGAFTALTNDVSSLYWNPAGIVMPAKNEFVFSDVEWVAGIRNNFAAAIFPGKYGVIGVNVIALTMSSEEVTTITQPDGTGDKWGAGAVEVGVSYARWFTDEFSFGVTAKMLRESIWEAASTGMAVDAGAILYPHVFDRLKFGIAITNFGADMQFKGIKESMYRSDWPSGTGPMDVEPVSQAYPMPLCIKLGLAYDLMKAGNNKITYAVDLAHPNDGPEQWHTGLEFVVSDILSLRGGYIMSSGAEGVSAFGVGIKCPGKNCPWSINYAGENRQNFGGLLHRFSIKWEG